MQADATPENSAKMLALADEATSMWLDMMSEAESALTPEERRALAALDEVLLSYSRRDGENAVSPPCQTLFSGRPQEMLNHVEHA